MGAGNVALVTVAFSEVGAGDAEHMRGLGRGDESKLHHSRALKGLGAQG